MADNSMALLDTLRKASGEGDVDVLREGVRILAQAIMEAEVSSQVCTALASLGLTPPDIDVWAFADATGRSRTVALPPS